MAQDGGSEEELPSAHKKRKTTAATPDIFSDFDHKLQQPHEGFSQHSQRRIVCDNCRQRRVRCDGEFPCRRCQNAKLACRRDHVPRKRGPKPGHGKVIDGIRARDELGNGLQMPFGSSADRFHGLPHVPSMAAAASPPSPWTTAPASTKSSSPGAEPPGPFSTDQLRPNARHHFEMIPQLVDLYYEHIYPIMPLVYMPSVREIISRPMTPAEKRYIFALCALTAFHMSGKSINAPGPAPSWNAVEKTPAWEQIGRSFLDESISARQSYDYEDDFSLPAIIASFWTSTSFFEINQSRKSWYYLKEALSLAQDLGIDKESKYVGLDETEQLCRRRVFWILFVTERSFAILRRKSLTFTRTPELPAARHSYEAPDIHAGFLKLIASYTPLDMSFVNAWNDEGGDPLVNKTAFQRLQDVLSHAPTSATPSPTSSPKMGTGLQPDQPEPTIIQKADLLMTQQWLRLIVWQASLRQGLLSSHAQHPSMRFSFPVSVAHDTLAVLHALPAKAVEVHGMGIFEKIFEIASTCVSVMGACESSGSANGPDVLGLVKSQPLGNPVEFFVRRLSASENSKHMFADKLLMLARERPAALKPSLMPSLKASPAKLPAPAMSSIVGPTSTPTVKLEPEADEGLYISSYSPVAQSCDRKRMQTVDRGESGEEEIERASSVCYANQFGSFLYGDAF